MSGKAYGNPWKYLATRFKKVFKASTHSETQLDQPQMTKIVLTSSKY